MKIVFMGTPDFAVSVLDEIIKAGHEVGYVLTQPDKAKNRGKKVQFTPVKELALENGITVLQPERVRGDEELYETLKAYNPDIMVVVAYGQMHRFPARGYIPYRLLCIGTEHGKSDNCLTG